MKTKTLLAVAAGITLSVSALAQTNSQTSIALEPMAQTPTFRVVVVSRSVQAVNYKHRSGASKIDFAGTAWMPGANGQAKVESKKGYIEIEVEFGNLQNPTTFGVCRSFVLSYQVKGFVPRDLRGGVYAIDFSTRECG